LFFIYGRGEGKKKKRGGGIGGVNEEKMGSETVRLEPSEIYAKTTVPFFFAKSTVLKSYFLNV
jgi:hypothetical protein